MQELRKDIAYPEPRWKGRTKIRHVIRLAAFGVTVLTLHQTFIKSHQGYSVEQKLVAADDSKRDVITLATVVFITSGTTYNIPANCNNAQIDCIGPGASGGVQNYTGCAAGGGGGAFSRKNSQALTPSSVVNIAVPQGAAGASSSGGSNGNTAGATWFGGSGGGVGAFCLANPGSAGGWGTTGGASGGGGGNAASGVGDLKYSGGRGGNVTSGTTIAGSGGGGAAGPSGNGSQGVDNGSTNTGTAGGAGDNGNTAAGADGTQYDATHGSGGGSGGASTPSAINQTTNPGGRYGGGSGGAVSNATNTSGKGGDGLIVLTYTPILFLTVNKAFGNFTLSNNTTVRVSNSLNKAFGNYTLASQVTVRVASTLNKAFNNFTLSSFVGNFHLSSLQTTFGNFTLAATTTSPHVVSLSATFGNFTLASALRPLATLTLNKGFANFTLVGRMTSYRLWPDIVPPDYPIAPQRDMNVLELGYGFYREAAANGINWNQEKTVSLRWGALTTDQKNIFEAFLKARGGTGRFNYRLPHWPNTETWVCSRWNFSYALPGTDSSGDRRWVLTATFERRFDPTFG